MSLLTDLSSEMVYPLLPTFLLGLAPAGQAAVWVGIMEGIAETTASALKLASGRASDALGRRKPLVALGYGLSALVRPLLALSGAAWHVVVLRFADRVGKGIRTSPRDAILADSAEGGNRAFAFSFHRSMDHAGAVIGPLAAGGLLWLWLGGAIWGAPAAEPSPESMTALRRVFALSLVPGVLAVVTILLFVREVAPAAAGCRERERRAWRSLPSRFRFFVASVSVFALGNSADLFLLLYGQTRFGFGMGAAMTLWLSLHVSKILFGLPGGWISDRFGRRRTILAGWALYALVYLGMARAATAGQFCVLFVTYGFYHGMTEGAEKALVADFVPSDLLGTAYGVYHGAVGIAALPASLAFGAIWSAAGPAAALGTGAGLAGLAALLLAFASSERRG